MKHSGRNAFVGSSFTQRTLLFPMLHQDEGGGLMMVNGPIFSQAMNALEVDLRNPCIHLLIPIHLSQNGLTLGSLFQLPTR
jgi:hypothetical protein